MMMVGLNRSLLCTLASPRHRIASKLCGLLLLLLLVLVLVLVVVVLMG